MNICRLFPKTQLHHYQTQMQQRQVLMQSAKNLQNIKTSFRHLYYNSTLLSSSFFSSQTKFGFCSVGQASFQTLHQGNKPMSAQQFFLNSDNSKLTPRQVVAYLDRFIIGQNQAKRAIAVSFRNRWRRKNLSQQIRAEISPKNLLIQGPTGSGKTQIARRLAKLTNAPFLRIQATKYTEVGYVGKDVSSIVQDIAKIALDNIKQRYEKHMNLANQRVKEQVYLQILDAMIGDQIQDKDLRQKKLKDLKSGHYSEQNVTVLSGVYKFKILKQLQEIHFPQRSLTRQVKQLYHILYRNYYDRIRNFYEIDLQKQAIRSVQEEGIVFIDEIDKLAVNNGLFASSGMKGVSTQGVQRDLLPIIEGTTVSTKYGDIKTDNILFIASGSFSMAKVDDLIPELLGRLPIKVKLSALSQHELERILTEPEFNLLFQHKKLLQTEKIQLSFTNQALKSIAQCAHEMNTHTENLGARRLQSIVEKIIQQCSFNAPEMVKQKLKSKEIDNIAGSCEGKNDTMGTNNIDSNENTTLKNTNNMISVVVNADWVKEKLKGFWEKTDLKKSMI